jgi:hypothetical protein
LASIAISSCQTKEHRANISQSLGYRIWKNGVFVSLVWDVYY